MTIIAVLIGRWRKMVWRPDIK